jgi:hypothetical protein
LAAAAVTMALTGAGIGAAVMSQDVLGPEAAPASGQTASTMAPDAGPVAVRSLPADQQLARPGTDGPAWFDDDDDHEDDDDEEDRENDSRDREREDEDEDD